MKQVPSPKSEQHLQALAEHAEWEWMLAQVVKSQQRYGPMELGSELAGEWLEEQRQLALRGKLSALRRGRLEEAGITLPKVEARRTPKAETVELPREEAAWEALYSRLDAWQAQHGHCEVPRAWAADPELALWVQELRRLRAQGRLAQAQQTRLKALGLFKTQKGTPNTKLWDQRYAELVSFYQEHQHTKVTGKMSRTLWNWRRVQQMMRKLGKLSADRIAKLEELGFEWESPLLAGLSQNDWWEQRRQKNLERLKAFRDRFGHCHVPVKWVEDPALAQWVYGQRRLWRVGKLPAVQVERLEELGFFQPRLEGRFTALWEQRYAEMVAYQKEYGHTNVRKAQDPVLNHWRDVQREFRKKGMLRADRIARLDEIGFEWNDPKRAGMSQKKWEVKTWEARLEDLKAFRVRYGHCQVPLNWEEDVTLASWVGGQRKLDRKGRLSAERRARLDELGFAWKSNSRLLLPPFKTTHSESPTWLELWEVRYAEMVAFQKEHGHTNVPKLQNAVLGRWRHAQREFYKAGKLSAERIARLDEIGFEWEAPGRAGLDMGAWFERLWETKLKELEAFKERFGHCLVPGEWPENPKLGEWVLGQRKIYRQGKLPEARVTRLEAVGFLWVAPSQISDPSLMRERRPSPSLRDKWEQRYAEMVAFQKEHGHTKVSRERNRVLGRWRHAQREFYKAGKLSAERIARLEEIGFTWES